MGAYARWLPLIRISRFKLLDLGRVEALLPQAEQVPYERPQPGERVLIHAGAGGVGSLDDVRALDALS